MGAAENGTITLIGKSGRTYHLDFQSPDATAGSLTFNPVGNATSTSQLSFQMPEDVWITDISIATGTTCTGACLAKNGMSIPAQIRWANHLDSLTQRPVLRIFFEKDSFLSGTTN